MRGVFFTSMAEIDPSDAYRRLGHEVSGAVEARLVSPEDFSLWLVRGDLGAGAAVAWGTDHGDEAVYVLDGEVVVDGRTCPAGGAVVVEAGVAVELRAPAGASIVHQGAYDPTPRVPGGHTAHVVGPGGTWAQVGDGRDTRYFADSECPTCRTTLFTTGRSHEYVSAPHSHSADELLHVLEGEVVVGRRHLGPGSTVAVAADRRYGFRSPGFTFLNYRPDVSRLTRDRSEPSIEEGGRAHGFDPVMDLR
jgi:quercetin dioxygenase-like cupin family protein